MKGQSILNQIVMYNVGIIEPKHVPSANQLSDWLTKPLGRTRVQFIYNKLSMNEIYMLQHEEECYVTNQYKDFYVKFHTHTHTLL